MQLTRNAANPILEKNPANAWEAGSVFNPTVWEHAPGRYGMLYRATNDVQPDKAQGYMSSLGLAWSNDGVHWERQPEPLVKPDQPYESALGCEDPRITKIDDTYYIFYTAVGGSEPDLNVRIALASTTDFASVTKYGVVGPDQYCKAGALFPERIGNQYHVIWADQTQDELGQSRSRIIHTAFDSLDQLTHHPADFWSQAKIDDGIVKIPPAGKYIEQEVGAVPIKTPDGWLLIYAGFSTEPAWTICAALLDAGDPQRVLAATPEPILVPETDREQNGMINNVCFPEGALIIGDQLYVYYGSGDQGICLATCKLDELMSELKANLT